MHLKMKDVEIVKYALKTQKCLNRQYYVINNL